MDQNDRYRLTITEGQPILDLETLCPLKTLDIKLRLRYESQFDGHGWYEDEVLKERDTLIEAVITDVREKVSAWIIKNNPFADFSCGPRPESKT